jgi:hypothetical protein
MAEAFRTAASSTGTVNTLRVYVDATSSATSLVAGLYTNSGTGHPGTLLGKGTLTSPTAGVWNDVTLTTGASVTAGTNYWIALLGPSGTLRFRDRCCGGGSPAETSSQTTLSTLQATWSSGTGFSDGGVSAVGLGTAGGSPPPPPPPPPPPSPPPPPAPTVLFGEQSILASTDSNGGGSAEAFQYTATASGTLSSIKAYVDVSSISTRVVAGVYTDAFGHPGALIGQGTLNTALKGAWNTITVGGGSITAGNTYWIALLSPAGSGTLAFRDHCCGGAGPTETSSASNLTALPGSWSTGTVFHDGPASAFATG